MPFNLASFSRGRTLALAALLLPALSFTAPAAADDAWPNKPIRMVIAFPPGGPTDAIGRVLFTELGKKLGQPIVIDNRPGAGGVIAASEVTKAPADGYTLYYASATIATTPALYNRPDLVPSKAFTPVSCTVSVPMVLMVAPSLPAKNMQEFVALLKASPGKYFQGSSGNGSPDHLAGVLLKKSLGVDFQHVPYKGNGPAITDVMAGNVTFMFGGALQTAVPLIDAGKLRALVVTADKRSSALPDVPTISETVLKGFDVGTWQAVVAPKGTPAAVVDRVNAKLSEVLAEPAIRASMLQQGADVVDSKPAACGAFMDKETARWTQVIEREHINIE
jgi:tripartite-type tricarboxylate transporter receptor subunit TctC